MWGGGEEDGGGGGGEIPMATRWRLQPARAREHGVPIPSVMFRVLFYSIPPHPSSRSGVFSGLDVSTPGASSSHSPVADAAVFPPVLLSCGNLPGLPLN